MFTEASQGPCVTAWVLDQIEAVPGITSADLRELVPPYMKPRSVAPALTKLTADGAVARRRERTPLGGNTFAYEVVDRDAATAHLTRPFRHIAVGDRPRGVTRSRRRALPCETSPEFNFEETNVTDTDMRIDAEDNVTFPTAEEYMLGLGTRHPAEVAFDSRAGMAGYGKHTGRINDALASAQRPTLKLHAVMSDGTTYVLTTDHARQLRNLLVDVR